MDNVEKIKFHLGELSWLCSDTDAKLYFLRRGVALDDLESFADITAKMIQTFYRTDNVIALEE
jgi:hypothetical protein